MIFLAYKFEPLPLQQLNLGKLLKQVNGTVILIDVARVQPPVAGQTSLTKHEWANFHPISALLVTVTQHGQEQAVPCWVA